MEERGGHAIDEPRNYRSAFDGTDDQKSATREMVNAGSKEDWEDAEKDISLERDGTSETVGTFINFWRKTMRRPATALSRGSSTRVKFGTTGTVPRAIHSCVSKRVR